MTDPAKRPITPTRVIPGPPSPAPWPPLAPPPPPPPQPPDPPAYPAPLPRPDPPPPVDVHVHVTVGHPIPEPEPEERWWQRIRIGYNTALALLSMPITAPWSWVLESVRDDESLAGAWVMAGVPLAVLILLDNARRVEAEGSAPDLWGPKVRAAVTRTFLWAAVIATALTLPVSTLVLALTGVQPA